MIDITCSVPCALNSTQLRAVFRDICRTINYTSPDREIALLTSRGLACEGWRRLPDWVHSGEISKANGEVTLNFRVESGIEPNAIKMLSDNLTRDLSSFFSHPVQPFRTQVFCVGWPKTGTTSLTEALGILGLFSWHFAPWVIGCKNLRSEVSQFQIDFTDIPEYTAISDVPICNLYQELDKAFPRSMFILTTRPIETWIASGIADVESSVKRDGCMHAIDRWAYDTDMVDREIFQQRYIQHQEQVLEYFSGRPDFLTIDISQGNPWQQLCKFLQLPVPDVDFPHLNRRIKE